VRSRVGLWTDRRSVCHAIANRTGRHRELDPVRWRSLGRKSAKLASSLVAVTVGVSLFTLVILLSAEFLRRLSGDVGLSIATRILGLLVASIRVQFVIAGLTDVIVISIGPAVLPQLHG
jgi:MarC family integral membrane protein